jgi:hypothetical protein
MPTESKLGLIRGTVMYRIMVQRPAPATVAAFSSWGSIFRRAPLIIIKEVGTNTIPLINIIIPMVYTFKGFLVRPNIFRRITLSAPFPGFNRRIHPKDITKGGTAIQENIRIRMVPRSGRSVRSVNQAKQVEIIRAMMTLPKA